MDSIHNDNIEYELIFRRSSFEEYKFPEYKVVDKIKGFSALPKGWDFGQGESPSEDVIAQAISIYQSGLLLGFNGDIDLVAVRRCGGFGEGRRGAYCKGCQRSVA